MGNSHTSLGKIAKILTIIGALNWGLVGLGNFLNFPGNLVEMLVGSIPMVENVVYILVGISAILVLTGATKR